MELYEGSIRVQSNESIGTGHPPEKVDHGGNNIMVTGKWACKE